MRKLAPLLAALSLLLCVGTAAGALDARGAPQPPQIPRIPGTWSHAEINVTIRKVPHTLIVDRGKITEITTTQLTLREGAGVTVVIPLNFQTIVDGRRRPGFDLQPPAAHERHHDADRRRRRRPRPRHLVLIGLWQWRGPFSWSRTSRRSASSSARYLTRDGYRVIWVRSGEEALAELDRHPVRIVILDIGLPGMDGFDVCREMRARSQVPILMLTARDEEPDRVVGLEVGADDYLTKPFSPRELVARMKAILRRTEPQERREALRARRRRRSTARPTTSRSPASRSS